MSLEISIIFFSFYTYIHYKHLPGATLLPRDFSTIWYLYSIHILIFFRSQNCIHIKLNQVIFSQYASVRVYLPKTTTQFTVENISQLHRALSRITTIWFWFGLVLSFGRQDFFRIKEVLSFWFWICMASKLKKPPKLKLYGRYLNEEFGEYRDSKTV